VKLLLFADERINSTLTCQENETAVIALIQRVTEASVRVDGEVIGHIGRGLLALIAVQPDDTAQRVSRMVERILTYRVFPDDEDRMNQSLLDQGLELLAVPQFTLAADTRKGTRPSFTRAAAPDKGREFFGMFLDQCRERLPTLASGRFGANMQVALVNDGPVTFWLES
jgi:D-tyrosyl-tRNA(Tyr) deacylase